MVSLLAFMHWLETGTLVLHSEVEEKLGCKFLYLFMLFPFPKKASIFSRSKGIGMFYYNIII